MYEFYIAFSLIKLIHMFIPSKILILIMSDLSLLYNGKQVFLYDNVSKIITCEYCKRQYGIVSEIVKTKLVTLIENVTASGTQKIEIKDLNTLLFRCIECDFSDDYPLKFISDPPFESNLEQANIIKILYSDTIISPIDHNHMSSNNYLIEGYAGTGKTSVISHLFKYPEFSAFKICFVAPTNKALQVLMDKLADKITADSDIGHDENDNNRDFKTIFKLLGNEVKVDKKGSVCFESSGKKLSHNYDIVVIDEVSMIDKKQFEYILGLTKHQSTTADAGACATNVKYIFLGDIGQLPPISEDKSIVFDIKVQSKYGIKCLMLEKIMRSDHVITNMSLKFRQLIPLHHINTDPEVIDFSRISTGNEIKFFNNKEKWIKNYVSDFHASTMTHENAPIILTYTNAECIALNKMCRNMIFNNPLDMFVSGELIVFDNYYSLVRCKVVDSKKTPYYIKFYTSEPMIIKNVKTSDFTISPISHFETFKSVLYLTDLILKKIKSMHLSKYIKNNATELLLKNTSEWGIKNGKFYTDNVVVNKLIYEMFNEIATYDHTYNVYLLGVNSNKIDKNDCDVDDCHIKVINHINIEKYKTMCEKICDSIKKTGHLMRTINDRNKTPINTTSLIVFNSTIDVILGCIWSNYYYRKYIWPFADVTHGYSITTHKSQGSTYRNIYVNIPNIMGCQKVTNVVKSKSLYTSITRAAKCVNILHNAEKLPPFLPDNGVFTCQICGKDKSVKDFVSTNQVIDMKCANEILSKIQQMTIYEHPDPLKTLTTIIFSDKYKNLHLINKDSLDEIHINDTLQYISSNGLQKSESDKYKLSNIVLAQKIKTKYLSNDPD
jgi:hypothetical protein